MSKLIALLIAMTGLLLLINPAGRRALVKRLEQNRPSVTQAPTTNLPTGTAPTQTIGKTGNPFGIMLPPTKFTSDQKLSIAKQLGAAYYRSADVKVNDGVGPCAECDAIRGAGIKLILTIRNGGGNGQPSTPPSDLNTYKQTVAGVIDRYKPTILVVENEENSNALFYSGNADQYHQELQAACSVAHSKGIKCTNGGIVSSLAAVLTADNYNSKGNSAKAGDYLKRAFTPTKPQYANVSILSNPQAVDQVAKGKALLSGYKAAGADYMNFHWYIADTVALSETAEFLTSFTGLPVLSNEMGQQQNEDPNQVTQVMQKVVALRLPVAIWFSVDTQGFGGSRSLVNEDGSLRPNGTAFKTFISQNY